MRGLDPRIHRMSVMDGRVRPGHDIVRYFFMHTITAVFVPASPPQEAEPSTEAVNGFCPLA